MWNQKFSGPRRISIAVVFFALFAVSPLCADASDPNHALVLSDFNGYFPRIHENDSENDFGAHFVKRVTNIAKEISFYAACDSSPATWTTGGRVRCGYTKHTPDERKVAGYADFPKAADVIRPEHDLIVVFLNDKLLRYSYSSQEKVTTAEPIDAEKFQEQVRGLLAEFPAGVPCRWIGPAELPKGKFFYVPPAILEDFYKNLKSATSGKCEVIDSRTLLQLENTGRSERGHGLHVTAEEGRAWADAVFNILYPDPVKAAPPTPLKGERDLGRGGD